MNLFENSLDKKWLKYIKIFEEFQKEIPQILKDVFYKIRKDIGNPTSSFNKILDLNDYNFIDTKINLTVNFNKLITNKSYHDREIIYHSDINIYDLIHFKKIIDVPIDITDVNIDIDKLCSIISHEMRHIYDVHVIDEDVDFHSFVSSLYLQNLKKGKRNKKFIYFLDMVYLSLEHELIARNTMIYENFINCRCSKDKLYELFKKSFMYKSFILLNNFNYNELLNSEKILENTNDFINFFGGDQCENKEDLILFYQKWKEYFALKSNEYLKESYKVLDDVQNLINENENKKEIKNVKIMLKEIYENYIK